MQTTLKVTELLSKNYFSNITVLGNYQICKYSSILDINNGTIFIVSDNVLYSFKDQNSNHWLTLLQSFELNGNKHYPKIGDRYTLQDGIQYSFTTKEEVVAMAVEYFDQHKCS